MKQSKKVRMPFLITNKAFLILCVVVGHFLDHFTEDFRIAEILRVYIYFFPYSLLFLSYQGILREKIISDLLFKSYHTVHYFSAYLLFLCIQTRNYSRVSRFCLHFLRFGIYWLFFAGDL